MPLSRTVTRALAASVALVAAGGTVAGAAVFHLPILGFGPANAGATAQPVAAVQVAHAAKKVAPIPVIKTRYVDEYVHDRGAAVVAAAAAPAVPTMPHESVSAPTKTAPKLDGPEAPDLGGGDSHESGDDNYEGDDEHGEDHEESDDHEDSEDHEDHDEDDAADTSQAAQ